MVHGDAMMAVFAVLNLVAVVATGGVGLLAWRRRRATPAALALTTLMIAICVWCLSDLVIGLAAERRLPEWAARAAFVPVVPVVSVVVASTWAMSRAVADRGWTPSRRAVALLSIHPTLMTAAVISNGWTGAVYRPQGMLADAHWWVWTPGWLFWPHTVYGYTLLTWGYLRLAQAWQHGNPLQRRQAGTVLVALLVPAPVNITLEVIGPGTGPDLTAVAFAATGLLAAYALLRHGLLQLVPVARGLVLERLRDAVIVIDGDERLLDVNLAGSTLIHALAPDLPDSLIGVPAGHILRHHHPGGRLANGEYTVTLPTGPAVLDVRIDNLTDTRGRPVGRVFVVRDVTELARLRTELAEQAVRDELTGLYNRRHLMAALESQLEAALRDGEDLCVVMLDIDHFKSVNDQHGHAIGDSLLKVISQALATNLRRGDLLARYGGEEFVVLMPNATRDQALHRADQLRHHCAQATVGTPTGPLRRTTSIGVASARHTPARAGHLTPRELLHAADEALYAAKVGGRDRVVIAA
jgi:diguanylate cyclase (GGDEF)-like protein